jgi:hypothetical protein
MVRKNSKLYKSSFMTRIIIFKMQTLFAIKCQTMKTKRLCLFFFSCEATLDTAHVSSSVRLFVPVSSFTFKDLLDCSSLHMFTRMCRQMVTYTFTLMFTHVYIHVYTCLQTCFHLCLHTFLHPCLYLRLHSYFH